METLSEISGYAASTLVLFTFVAKHASPAHHRHLQQPRLHHLRYHRVAAARLFLHLVLLPLNIVRLAEIVRAPRATADLTQTDGAVRAQTLCADMQARDQSPLAPWLFFLSAPKSARPA